MSRLPVGYSVRLAVVKKVEQTHVICDFIDRPGEKSIRCPIPHPYAGRGGGILIGIEKNTIVLVATGPGQKSYIVGIIPDINFYSDVAGKSNIRFDESEYPNLKEGEISIKGNVGQRMDFLNSGNITVDAGLGDSSADIELSRLSQAMFVRTNNIYRFTEAGRNIEGIIRRDLNEEDDNINLETIDILTSEAYDTFLSDVGRSPTDEVNRSSSTLIKDIVRNPPLIERRDILYEYANSFGVENFETESDAMLKIDAERIVEPDLIKRQNRRTDILNLNHDNYNHLIERVEGTLVDIYGNILDINRNIIPVPDTRSIDLNSPRDGLSKLYSYLRRSVKYHFEINARKNITDSSPALTTLKVDNGKNFSKWSVDIDGEGLTKVNIPASSENGNIPVLARYINSKSKDGDSSFKDPLRQDIRISQFGARKTDNDAEFAGQRIVDDSGYVPKTLEQEVIQEVLPPVTVGTAHHDMLNIASSIFTNGKFKNPSFPYDNANVSVPPMVNELSNKIQDNNAQIVTPNAGGRSLHMNLDGSAEISIGADTADRKSLVMDLAGGVISHFGRDKNGRSLIHQTDGDVIIQIGGPGIDDKRFETDGSAQDRPGRLEIHLNRPNGGSPQKIIIDEGGITFDIQGNSIFSASGDLVLSGARVLINGETITNFGKFDINTRVISGSETRVSRKGRHI